MEHLNDFSKEFDVEDAVGPSEKVNYTGIVDLNQHSSTNFSVKEVTASTYRKDGQAHADSAILLIEAKTRLYIACAVVGTLILSIICGFVITLLRGDNSILCFILGVVDGLVTAIIGHFFVKREKRL